MTTTLLESRPPRLRRRGVRRPLMRASSWLAASAVVCVLASALLLLLTSDADRRAMLAPLLACPNLALIFLTILYRRDQELPVFESGTFFVASTTVYSTVPMLNYLAGGMSWRTPSDWRLVGYDPSPAEMSAFAWNYVLYLATFIVVYLLIRGRKRVPRVFAPVPSSVQTAVIVTFAVMMVLVEMVKYIVLPPEAGVSVYEGGNFSFRANVPHVFLQFLNIGVSALLVLKLLFAVLVLARWRERRWRVILLLWLLVELVLVVRSMARGPLVVLLLMIAIAYHRLVRPLSLKLAVVAGSALVVTFLGFGIMRDTKGRAVEARQAYTINNEFQVIFANAYDVHMRRQLNVLPEPPPQMRFAELYMVIPSQILPFPKTDPAEWYAEVLGISHTGQRVVFGVITGAMLGSHPAVEIFLRAVLIAVILGSLHRWYVRRASRFWPTALYAYITVLIYYSFRSNTLAPLYQLVYYFGVAACLVLLVKFALGRGGRGKSHGPAPAPDSKP